MEGNEVHRCVVSVAAILDMVVREGLPMSWHLREIYTHEKVNCEISGRNPFQGDRIVRASGLRVGIGLVYLRIKKKS